MKKIISTEAAPKAIGPYSQGVSVGELVFTSGQLPIDPSTGDLVEGSIGERTTMCLKNCEAILKAAGSDMSKVVKTTVFITDMALFGEVNTAYSAFFPSDAPARSCFAVKELPKGSNIEIEVIAHK